MRFTVSTLSVVCISEFLADITEPTLLLKKVLAETIYYHRVSGARFSQCLLPLKVLCSSVSLKVYNNLNHMNGFS